MITLSTEQNTALEAMMAFIFDKEHDIFILHGGAGSGKTSVIARLVHELKLLETSHKIMAPTGRAARILADKLNAYSQNKEERSVTSTIHSAIYEYSHTEEGKGAPVQFYELKQGTPDEKVLIMDEASMIGDLSQAPSSVYFGSGKLLSDILEYVEDGNKAQRCKIIFVGDYAQLMPINESLSPALSVDYLAEHFNKKAKEFTLTQTFRQQQESGVLANALAIRSSIEKQNFSGFKLTLGLNNIEAIAEDDIAEAAAEKIRQQQSCIMLAHTNNQVFYYNHCIRELLWDNPQQLQIGDRLVALQNSGKHPILNGDMLKIVEILDDTQHVSVLVKKYGKVDLAFRKIKVCLEDASQESDSIIEVKILESLLFGKEKNITLAEKMALEAYFKLRYPQKNHDAQKLKQLYSQDPYVHALQVKFGYAITCHKAQGGEWQHVYIDFDYQHRLDSAEFYRWAYTAITRSAHQLYAANAPLRIKKSQPQVEEEL